jgi:hypothetical protein
MKQLLLICAVVVVVGCGESDITQCYWCKEDIKKGALICKHCGKTPNENRVDQEPDKTTGSGLNTKPPVDTWASKSHPDQVTIREVETDKDAYASNFDLFGENLRLGPKAKGGFIIKGTIRLTTYFPKDEWILARKDGSRMYMGKFFDPLLLYAFEITDHTGSAYAYGLKSDPDIKSLREQLLRERSERMRGFFKLRLKSNFPIHDYSKIHANFIKVITEGIDEGTSSSAPSKNNEPKSPQPSVGEAEKDSSQKKEKGWPWWKYPIGWVSAIMIFIGFIHSETEDGQGCLWFIIGAVILGWIW